MFPNISISSLIGGMIILMLPVSMAAQESSLEPSHDSDREHVLLNDISRLSERAVRDHVISPDEKHLLQDFIRDSLPDGNNIRIKALEQIRDELDEKYADKVRQAQKLLDEAGYIGGQMLPDQLYEPEDYVSPEKKRRGLELAAAAGAAIDMNELMKYVKPLPIKPWLMTSLRMLFGRGVSQRPQRWDYTTVPQMGGVYNIIIPGGRPDDSWRDAPKMAYDPHPDKHFRR